MARPMSMQPSPAQVALMLAEPDSLRLLHRAFTGSRDCWSSLAIRAAATADRAQKARDSVEVARHTARVKEYERRATIVQGWIDQLPPIPQE